MDQLRLEDEQALYRAELRRNGALRWALVRQALREGVAGWTAWFAGWIRRA